VSDIEALRVEAVRELCKQHNSEGPLSSEPGYRTAGALTNRGWLAQSILNILNGNIDDQLLNLEGVQDPDDVKQALTYLRKAVTAAYANDGPTPVLVEIRNAMVVLGADVGPFVP
jgi:hypothetical protein